MDSNEYFVELLVRQRLAEARALAERWAPIDSVRPPRQPARVALGLALIRLGRWVLGRVPEPEGAPDLLSGR